MIKGQLDGRSRRRLLLFALMVTSVLLNQVASNAQSANLGWAAATNAGVSGYALYYGTNSGNYSVRIDVGTNNVATTPALTEGATYYFVVTCYDPNGIESSPSTEISYTAPSLIHLTMPGALGDGAVVSFFATAGHAYEIQTSNDLQTWNTVLVSAIQTNNNWFQYEDTTPINMRTQQFYRYIQL